MSFTNLTVLSHGRTIRDEYLFPDAEYETRLEKANDLIKSKGLDGLLLYSNSLTRGNVCYLSGFSNFIAWSVSILILPKGGYPTLVAAIAPRDVEFTSKLLPGFVKVISAGLSLVSNEHISASTIDYMRNNGLLAGKKWGSVNFGRLPYMAQTPWNEAYPDGLVDCTDDFAALRACKSEKEAYVISQASSMAKRAVYEYMREARPGVDEAVLASKIDREQRICGANSVSMLTSAGKLSEPSLHFPRERAFENGDTVCVFADIGLQSYHGSFGATKVIGAPTGDQEELFAVAQKLWDAKIAEMYADEKSQIGQQDTEHGNYQYYTMVNGIGCDLVEYPSQFGSEAKLSTGMTITLSMGIKRANVGSVFMSENYLVTANGLVSMSGPGK